MAIDHLAEVRADSLILRAAPSLAATRLGLLPKGDPAYVVDGPVEADGYDWYELASVREPYTGDCGDPAPPPSLECANWFGWAAAGMPGGDQWLVGLASDCPSARDTTTYLELALSAARLACAGADEWTLTAYVAPEAGGRGCFPMWVISPGWLDGSCGGIFLQPTENQLDSFEGLKVYVEPDLGSCGITSSAACSFDALKGSWVEVSGHLDDPVARTCTVDLSDFWVSQFGPSADPGPPPDPDSVIFACRLRLVVTGIQPGTAAAG